MEHKGGKQKLPIDVVKLTLHNQVQVITVVRSFGATDIERLVTFPIEQANNNISGSSERNQKFLLALVYH